MNVKNELNSMKQSIENQLIGLNEMIMDLDSDQCKALCDKLEDFEVALADISMVIMLLRQSIEEGIKE